MDKIYKVKCHFSQDGEDFNKIVSIYLESLMNNS